MCRDWEVPKEAGQRVDSKLWCQNDFRGKLWQGRWKCQNVTLWRSDLKSFLCVPKTELERSTCFSPLSAYIHYWPVGTVCCTVNMADMLSRTAICCSWRTLLCCFYQLYLTNQCWHALAEHSLIFQATVLWLVTLHIDTGWNGLFYTWQVYVCDIGLIWAL